MKNTITTISPVNNEVCYQCEETDTEFINEEIDKMILAQKQWSNKFLYERIAIINKFILEIAKLEDYIYNRLSIEMGRPISFCKWELKGLVDRALHMMNIAQECLKPVKIDNNRHIEHCPLGIVMIISAWNYPYLTSINGLIPSLLAGNAVIFKGSSQTPTTGLVYEACLRNAGLPEHLFLNLHISHKTTETIVADRRINYVAFTGSVRGGQTIANSSNNCNLRINKILLWFSGEVKKKPRDVIVNKLISKNSELTFYLPIIDRTSSNAFFDANIQNC